MEKFKIQYEMRSSTPSIFKRVMPKFAIFAVMLLVVSCKEQSTSSRSPAQLNESSTSENVKIFGVPGLPEIIGPQVSFWGTAAEFELSVPFTQIGTVYRTVTWDMGDGTTPKVGVGPHSHNYRRTGHHQVRVTLVDTNGVSLVLVHSVNIVDAQDGLSCVTSTRLKLPYVAETGATVPTSVQVPSCLSNHIAGAVWNFGDSTPSTSVPMSAQGILTSHVFSNSGLYFVTVQVYAPTLSGGDPYLTLSQYIRINTLVTPTPTIPEPSPTVTPPIQICTIGATRESFGSESSEQVTCENNGTKRVVTHLRKIETCRLVGDHLKWVVTSERRETVREGLCEGQSCRLPDGTSLVHGSTRTIVTGEVSVPLKCQYGEVGIVDIFDQLSDVTCNNGRVDTQNVRQGDLKSAGQCPVYRWVPTEEWTRCSADCGGTQNMIHRCVTANRTGSAVAPSERCGAEPSAVIRICDGNPGAVRSESRQVRTEDGGQSMSCPSHQIGTMTRHREVTEVKTFACINHSVQLESQNTIPGDWVVESYCRDYFVHRCTHDNLDTSGAEGRYRWMEKCQDQIPMVKDFLTNVKNVKVEAGLMMGTGERHIYPTFMNRSTTPETLWVAPSSPDASCVIPNSVYIAAVCVSSCATPEQLILSQDNRDSKMMYQPFIEALGKKSKYVSTLPSHSARSSRSVDRTAVDQWVTELLEGEHQILEFHMKSGRSLRLTPNHPVLDDTGSMRLASEFRVGENLVELGWTLDPIVSIRQQTHFGRVYNLFVKSADLHKNVVITNGYLNGTAFFQNEGSQHLNRVILRQKLTRGVFEK